MTALIDAPQIPRPHGTVGCTMAGGTTAGGTAG